MASTNSVLVVVGSGLVSEVLVELLGAAPGLQVVGVAGTIREGRLLLLKLAPDIVVADHMLEDGNAIEILRVLRRERMKTRLVLLTELRDTFAFKEALAAGASGYVLKRQPVRELLEAISLVSKGERYVSPMIEDRDGDAIAVGADARIGLEKLSRREEGLRLIVSGYTCAQIAHSGCVSARAP